MATRGFQDTEIFFSSLWSFLEKLFLTFLLDTRPKTLKTFQAAVWHWTALSTVIFLKLGWHSIFSRNIKDGVTTKPASTDPCCKFVNLHLNVSIIIWAKTCNEQVYNDTHTDEFNRLYLNMSVHTHLQRDHLTVRPLRLHLRRKHDEETSGGKNKDHRGFIIGNLWMLIREVTNSRWAIKSIT